ncbi:2-hydroxyacid dehydrogenase [Sneathiella glossodoripedis]|uniref:2-hydroxyacid dehydrogenase n=1 Tax=Sneathiella glossodoripedis TaxID=418853 RepID=UPI0004729645|nr:glyoxylate/hydroxypyruvate reductase A [Sneathiella glossodoripedis]
MQNLIAFAGQIEETEKCHWISRLSKKIPLADIIAVEDLTVDQRDLVEIAIVANPDPETLSVLPNLKWVHSVWAGVERMIEQLADQNLMITRLKDPELARTMAEASLAWTLYIHRNMPEYAKQQRAKKWKELPYRKASQVTVGILGLGSLGARSAEVLRVNGFSVHGWSRTEKQLEGIRCLSGDSGLSNLLCSSDILIVLLPLTNETRGLLGARLLKSMKKGASVINFARGPIVDVAILEDLLDTGHLSHAVLDVFDEEPLDPSSTLWSHPDITILPHISAPTDMETASEIVGANVMRFLETGELPEIVDTSRGY